MFEKLCTPAYVYLVVSVITIIVMAIQSMTSQGLYCAGTFACSTTNIYLLFFMKILYVAFWTWLLNLFCKKVSPILSWILVAGPFVLMLIFISMYLLLSARDIPQTNGVMY